MVQGTISVRKKFSVRIPDRTYSFNTNSCMYFSLYQSIVTYFYTYSRPNANVTILPT